MTTPADATIETNFLGSSAVGLVRSARDLTAAALAVELASDELGLSLGNDWAWAQVLADSPALRDALSVEVYLQIETRARESGNQAAAETTLRYAIAAHPGTRAPLHRLVAQCYARGEHDSAELLAVNHLRADSADESLAQLVASEAAKTGLRENAAAALRLAASAQPRASVLFGLWMLGCARIVSLAAADDALKSCARALGLAPLPAGWSWGGILSKFPAIGKSLHVTVFFFLEEQLRGKRDVAGADAVLSAGAASWPDVMELTLRRAQSLFKQGKRADADTAILQILAGDPGSVPGAMMLARLAAAEGVTPQTSKALAAAVSAGVPVRMIFALWFEASLKTGNLEDARAAVGAAVPDLPADATWSAMTAAGSESAKLLEARHYWRLGECLSEAGDTGAAAAVLRAAATRFPNDAESQRRFAKFLYDQEKTTEATAVVTGFLARMPGDASSLALYVAQASKTGAPADMNSILAAAIKAGVPPETHLLAWVSAQVKARDLAAARTAVDACAHQQLPASWDWRTALSSLPPLAAAPHSLALQLFECLHSDGQSVAAEDVLRYAAGAFPKVLDPTLRLSDLLHGRGDVTGADALLAGFLARNPSDSAVALTLARRLRARGEMRQATQVLHEAWQRGAAVEEIIGLWVDICLSSNDSAGARQAVETCAKDLGLHPLHQTWSWPEVLKRSRKLRTGLHVGAYYVLENYSMAAGDRTAADEIMQDAIEVFPDYSGPTLRLAARLYELEGPGAGDIVMRSFLMRHPNDEHVARLFASRFAARSNFEDARDVLSQAMQAGVPFVNLAMPYLDTLLELGQAEKAAEAIQSALKAGKFESKDGWVAAATIATSGKLESAKQVIDRSMDSIPPNHPSRADALRLRDYLGVRLDTAAILKSVPLNGAPKGVAAVISQKSPLMPIWTGLAMAQLARQGFAPVVLDQSQHFPVEATGDAAIDALNGILDCSFTRLSGDPQGPVPLRHEWTIDPARQTIAAAGFNFYQPIAARIGTAFRRYKIDFDHPAVRVFIRRYIAQCDAALALCARITENVAKRGLIVRFLGCMTHYPPAAVYRAWCHAQIGKTDMQYVTFDSGYDLFYSNVPSPTTTSISVANLTRNPAMTSPCHAVTSRFAEWRKEQTDKTAIADEAARIAALDRAGAVNSPGARDMREKIMAHRLAGGRVVALFGKMVYDVWLDADKGPAHANMLDWINHTVKTLAKSDVMLLIKPHPYETMPELWRTVQYFTELVPRPLAANIHILDHRWFNIKDMVKLIDVSVMWNGSAGLELLSQGVPVIMCSHWAEADPTMHFTRPRDRAEYETLLRNPGSLYVPPSVREDAALLLKYMSTDEVIIPYDYANMPALRGVDAGAIRWNMERAQACLEKGDPHVDLIVRRILGE